MFPLFLVLCDADYKTPNRPGVNVSYVLMPALCRLEDTKQAMCQYFLCFKSCMGQITRQQAGLVSMLYMFYVLHAADYKTSSRPGVNVSSVLSHT